MAVSAPLRLDAIFRPAIRCEYPDTGAMYQPKIAQKKSCPQ